MEELTLKQRKWLKLYLELGNATEAAMQVYDCKDRDSAKNIGYENVTKLDFGELMEEAGLTDNKLRQKLSEGLEATRVKTSLTEPDRVVPDYPTQHKFLETALKLKRKLVERQEITGKDGEPLKINIIAYGTNDPVPIRSTSVHGASPSRPAPVSSPELASESSQDNAGNQ